MDRSSFLAWLLTLSPSTAEVSLIPTCHVYVLYFSDFTFSVCGSFSVFDFLLPSDKCDKLASNRIMLHCTFDEMFIRICCRLNTERERELLSTRTHRLSLFWLVFSPPSSNAHTIHLCTNGYATPILSLILIQIVYDSEIVSIYTQYIHTPTHTHRVWHVHFLFSFFFFSVNFSIQSRYSF